RERLRAAVTTPIPSAPTRRARARPRMSLLRLDRHGARESLRPDPVPQPPPLQRVPSAVRAVQDDLMTATRPSVKTIVCFGDSNTWGYVPGSDGERFPRDVRWPARLATALGDEAEVIAEGLNGRTATIESPVAEGRNGLPYLVPCLRSHAPVHLLLVYLGTDAPY